ncbi:LptF/LptG family permease [Candidatus Pelagibacter sp.]|nr:LptF/LptG family permease [Candidatus Pelagibacter sp.]
MKKLIYRKIQYDIVKFFILSSISISLIVWVIQAVNFLDFVSEDGHSFRVYFNYTLLIFPKIFSRIFLFSFFISLFYILIRYEEFNELIIYWTVGISKLRLANKLIQFSILFLIVQSFISIVVVPFTQDAARSFIRNSDIDMLPSLIKEKKFIDTVSDLTIFVDEKTDDGQFLNIFLKEQIEEGKSQTIFAKRGELIKKNNLIIMKLYNGTVIKLDDKKNTTFTFATTELNLSKFSTKTTTFPKIQELETSLLFNCFQSMTFKNKSFTIFEKLICDENSIMSVKGELYKRIYLPIYIPLLTLVACLLILKSKDDFNYNYHKIYIFILGIAVIILAEISTRYIGKDIRNELIFFIIPIIFYFVVYLSFFSILKYKKTNL